MEEVRIIDTTLRDGNTSLWAHNMTTGMMHPVLKHMDQAGFDAMEFFVSGRFKKVVREQRDNPWDWVRYGQREIKNTRLRYHGGISGGFILIPRCIPRLVIKTVVSYGITMTRLSDPWNDYEELAKEVEEIRDMGMESVVNVIYSVSPRHTDEYYARKAREAAALRPYRICFKDVGGMLTPERTRKLARLFLDNAGDVPVEFHAHCNNGLAPFNLLEAVQARHPHRSHIRAAPGQRFGAALGVQCRQQFARAGIQTPGEREGSPSRRTAFPAHRKRRRAPRRRAARI